jgi:hypothetical protein
MVNLLKSTLEVAVNSGIGSHTPYFSSDSASDLNLDLDLDLGKLKVFHRKGTLYLGKLSRVQNASPEALDDVFPRSAAYKTKSFSISSCITFFFLWLYLT